MRLGITRPLAIVVFLSAFALGLVSPSGRAAAQTPGEIEGSFPANGGFVLVVWTGGSPESLMDAARARGCSATAAWITVDGALVGYIHGAPEFVNADFRGHFPGSSPARTALVLVCSPPGTGLPPPESGAPEPLEQQFGAAAFDAINAARQQAGLGPLNLSPQLRAAAEKYARLLVDTGQMNHSIDGEPWDRAQREGYPSGLVGEIIASAATSETLNVQRETRVLLDTWLNSPPHRDIIMGAQFAFTDLGVGCAVGQDSGGLNLVVCVGMTGIP